MNQNEYDAYRHLYDNFRQYYDEAKDLVFLPQEYLALVQQLKIPYTHGDGGCIVLTVINALEIRLTIEKRLYDFQLGKPKVITFMSFVLKFRKTLPNAVIPSKTYMTDVGYDLTVVKFLKQEGDVYFYDSGIQAQIPPGYYAEIVPRSSISKTQYSLANSVGIIDPSYSGNLIVALRSHNNKMPHLQLPSKIAQLVIKKTEYMIVEESFENFETTRGVGGFGSTNSTQPGTTTGFGTNSSTQPSFTAGSTTGFGTNSSTQPSFTTGFGTNSSTQPSFTTGTTTGFGTNSSTQPSFTAGSSYGFGTTNSGLPTFNTGSTTGFGTNSSTQPAFTAGSSYGFGTTNSGLPTFNTGSTTGFGTNSSTQPSFTTGNIYSTMK